MTVEAYKESNRTVSDLVKVTCGKDRYTDMCIEELESEVGRRNCKKIRKNLFLGEYSVALQWFCRGLNILDACKKADICIIEDVIKVYNSIKK